MILPYVDALSRMRIVLASGSPRRLSLLQGAGLTNTETYVSSFAEDLPKSDFTNGGDYVMGTARHKAEDVYACLQQQQQQRPVDILIAADTVVVLPGPSLCILEKAHDAEEAAAMLRRMSGTVHEVWTGVVLGFRSTKNPEAWDWKVFSVCTKVSVAALSEALISSYLKNTAAWEGKAGAYGIQDTAGSFIEGIEGDYYNVMGLPLQRTCAEIAMLIENGDISLSSSQ